MALNKYLNPSFSGNYAQATINGVEGSFDTGIVYPNTGWQNNPQAIVTYLNNLTLETAKDTEGDLTTDLANLGLIIGFARPSYNGAYLDRQSYIDLLKQVAVIKYNGMTYQRFDEISNYCINYNGTGTPYDFDYTVTWSSGGRSSPNSDIIINLYGNNVPSLNIYLLNTVLSIFLKQGIIVNIIGEGRNKPFVFAKWNGSAWGDNPLGKGMSRLAFLPMVDQFGNYLVDDLGQIMVQNTGTLSDIADTEHGGQFYGVI